jgi:hypothetical protein
VRQWFMSMDRDRRYVVAAAVVALLFRTTHGGCPGAHPHARGVCRVSNDTSGSISANELANVAIGGVPIGNSCPPPPPLRGCLLMVMADVGSPQASRRPSN